MTTTDPGKHSTEAGWDELFEIDAGRWRVWRGAVLRGAGFPVSLVSSMAVPELAALADSYLENGHDPQRPASASTREFASRFVSAAEDAAERIREVAADPLFREAVMWQNPPLIGSLLNRFEPTSGRGAKQRKREIVIASYLQRYTTKNESIGFFGPVGWAKWNPNTSTHLTVGKGLVSERRVYFENWAIDAVRERIVVEGRLRPQLAPRRSPSTFVYDGVAYRSFGRPLRLSPDQIAVMAAIDGVRTFRELAAEQCPTVSNLDAVLRELEAAQVVCVDLGGPIEARPELHLASRLAAMEGPDAAAEAKALARLISARDDVASAAGDPSALGQALERLAEVFEEVAHRGATRLHGKTYAGRSVVYEDTRRAASLGIGSEVLSALEGPLSLVLQSGRWLTGQLASRYRVRFEELWQQRVSRTGAEEVPLPALLALAARDFYTGDGPPPIARQVAADLAERWARVLQVDERSTRVRYTTDGIAAAVDREFGAVERAWSAARHHSPDVMIAAESVEAIAQGDFQLVLGELHLAFNTVESRALVEQHDDPAALLRMAEAAVGRSRFLPAAPREWGSTTSRTSPPSALISDRDVYWSLGPDDDSHLPGGSIPAAGLVVRREGRDLVVAHRGGASVAEIGEFLGEHLSGVAVNCFTLLPKTAHTPRVTIDQLVVARETWRIASRECDWSRQMDEATRFLQMRLWRRRRGLPERAFYKVPTETKPSYVDFTSPALVNLFATHLRRLEADQTVTISEMLPDVGEAWLEDDRGLHYTAELRMVVAEGQS